MESTDYLSKINNINFKRLSEGVKTLDLYPDEIYILFPELNAVDRMQIVNKNYKGSTNVTDVIKSRITYYIDYGRLSILSLIMIRELNIKVDNLVKENESMKNDIFKLKSDLVKIKSDEQLEPSSRKRKIFLNIFKVKKEKSKK